MTMSLRTPGGAILRHSNPLLPSTVVGAKSQETNFTSGVSLVAGPCGGLHDCFNILQRNTAGTLVRT